MPQPLRPRARRARAPLALALLLAAAAAPPAGAQGPTRTPTHTRSPSVGGPSPPPFPGVTPVAGSVLNAVAGLLGTGGAAGVPPGAPHLTCAAGAGGAAIITSSGPTGSGALGVSAWCGLAHAAPQVLGGWGASAGGALLVPTDAAFAAAARDFPALRLWLTSLPPCGWGDWEEGGEEGGCALGPSRVARLLALHTLPGCNASCSGGGGGWGGGVRCAHLAATPRLPTAAPGGWCPDDDGDGPPAVRLGVAVAGGAPAGAG